MANFVVYKIYFNKADQKAKESTELRVKEILILTTITESLQWVRFSAYVSPFLDWKQMLKDVRQHS